MWEENYTKAAKDAVIKEFYQSGQLKTEQFYQDGKRVKEWKTYHSNGESYGYTIL